MRMRRRLGLNGATTGPADLTLDLQAAREAGLGALGCPLVVAVAGPRGETALQEATERTAQTLRAMAAIARQHGVRIGFEFLGFPGISVRTLQEACSVVEAVGDSAVGLVLDTFHFHVGGSTPGMLQGLETSRLLIVHLNHAEDRPPTQLTDAHRLLPGDGVVPLAELVASLETLGYSGVYSVELFRPEYWEWEPERLAREVRHRLLRLLE